MLDQCDCTCGLDDVSVTELCDRFRPNFPIQTNLFQLGIDRIPVVWIDVGRQRAKHDDSAGLPFPFGYAGVCLRMIPLYALELFPGVSHFRNS